MKISDIAWLEFLHIKKDRRLAAVLFLIPALYLLIFGYLYSAQKVRELPTLVVDEENSYLSRELVRAYDQSETFRISGFALNETEAQKEIDAGRAQIVLIIPAGLTRDLKEGKSPAIMTLINGSNMIIANAATRAANEIVATFGAGASLKVMEAAGINPEKARHTLQPLLFRYRVLYNPTFNYTNFLLPGLLGAVIQQVLLLGVALAITREKEQGTWIRLLQSPGGLKTVLLGKGLVYFLVGCLDSLLTFALLHWLWGVPIKGNGLLLLVFNLLFILALVAVGLTASLFSRTQLEATQVTMLIAMPSFLLSGYTWPMLAIPDPLKPLSFILPLTYYTHGLRALVDRGQGWQALKVDVAAFLALIFLCWLLLKKFATNFAEKQENNPVGDE
ncbi:ABC transporter permease [Carboxydocella sp. JDF658]|uniref:ABC transporter permease n=1 Tax=Carboxydocella sp. JDF658 TaxID=1926600 RepID=UPI0009AE167A|nr:ABC transporter permease [Carboxydocella sp. JDF658]AVX30658.1 ABC-2 type transport system permease protein [Carboxydocella thermautotrophica]GAW31075.1 multidrug ABC transporter permease [Carboxydocella sp. JDF658]